MTDHHIQRVRAVKQELLDYLTPNENSSGDRTNAVKDSIGLPLPAAQAAQFIDLIEAFIDAKLAEFYARTTAHAAKT